jgi:hypothetical protein
MGMPNDITKGIVFLASDAAAFIAGAGLVIDGQNLERELIKGHGGPLSTLSGRSLRPAKLTTVDSVLSLC